jgi:hypothetical protein
MIELPSSTEEMRRLAREMIADHGKAALTIAEWNAIACEDGGKAEEAKRWMIVAGTILAMTED